MNLNVSNETSTLKAVVLGQPGSIGKIPTLDKTYDAKSYESVINGVYPTEESIYKEMSAFEKVLHKYDVQVFRPWTLENCNQVYARDVGNKLQHYPRSRRRKRSVRSNLRPNTVQQNI
jgi:hypothetical protein